MMSLPAGSRIWIVAGITDMRNGFNGLAMLLEGINWKHPQRMERPGLRI
ncbi:hypothetical protein KGP23_24450 (plasmid) [Serratia ureilytica]|nr:hypothetical protein [Serratia ureilytica]UAN29724.1 hypothetical protein KGP23_24450 [Serratia ureilytica]